MTKTHSCTELSKATFKGVLQNIILQGDTAGEKETGKRSLRRGNRAVEQSGGESGSLWKKTGTGMLDQKR